MKNENPLLQAIHPDLREGTAKTPTVNFGNPILFPLLQHVAFPLRGFKSRYRGDDVTITVLRAGRRSLRLYTPKERTSNGAFLWMHGGGLIVGHPRQDDRLCARLAKTQGGLCFRSTIGLPHSIRFLRGWMIAPQRGSWCKTTQSGWGWTL